MMAITLHMMDVSIASINVSLNALNASKEFVLNVPLQAGKLMKLTSLALVFVGIV